MGEMAVPLAQQTDPPASPLLPDISQSFFVGDSYDGGDEGFASALGLAYRSEKQEFG